ncbi:hypothetical protein FHS43_002950 [Streptosporangium becharense]|uniref:Uncharacterized protein n=1 Tax=Streptosporangium becharense TaxID=1816182 RepID=A0A7W9MIY7_9ACTN|nr:hypothetical protein [Streptosporangium becharense]MBB2911677.1 hypothetical protein [Streptosporangium becharense]MBB5822505.1 hypothetical protein [Streptosporangium becharense]
MMLIRSADDRLVSPAGTGWRVSSGTLELRLGRSSPDEPVHAVVHALLVVDLDDRSRVLDVDVIGLPSGLLTRLRRYAAPPRPAPDPVPGSGPVALDLDAAWLWIHVQDGRRAHRHRRPAIVRFSFAGERLTAIRAHLPAPEGEPG